MKMNKKIVVPIAGGVLLLALALIFFVIPRPPRDFTRLRAGRDFNVILITLDTVRADKIGCYGCDQVRTPGIDGLAARGLRFQECIAQTPLTLPSHTTILTGTFPNYHGVRDNGGFVAPPEIVTLAEVFKQAGYQTAAFVAAYVLDSHWGLDQGFDTYFDQFDLSEAREISLGNIRRPANEVVDQVLPWLEARKSDKFFVWVHLYDPHSPYQPPPPYDREYAGQPYLGEIAFADSQVGRLWDFVEQNGLADRTFVVFAGDHGESLGDHQEETHGFFLYQETLRVPLIFVTPFTRLNGRVSERPAQLADIMPTILEMCGQPRPPQVQGRSLVREFFGRSGERPGLIYSETYSPRFHFGWSELRSVQDERYQLIIAPRMELYDLDSDPGELHNLADSRLDLVRSLRARAEDLTRLYGRDSLKTDMRRVDQSTRERLAALGYLGSFVDSSQLEGKVLADPKDKIGIVNSLGRALEMGLNGQADKAIPIVQGIIAQDPDIIDAYFTLGNIYDREGRYAEAIAQYRIALGLRPDDTFAVMNIANCYRSMGRLDQAEKFVLDYVAQGHRDSALYFLLGGLYLNQENYDVAAPYIKQGLSLNPESATGANDLAAIFYLKEDYAQAESYAREAVRLNPRLRSAHFNLAQILAKEDRTAEAEAEYLQELRVNPKHFKAAITLALIYRAEGRKDEELKYLEQWLENAPESAVNCFYVALAYYNNGQDLPRAIELIEKGLTLNPGRADLGRAYLLLARIYARQGDTAKSEEYARESRRVTGSGGEFR
jgi:arylsulfatase A-like enzyme/Flp pilus assembly protein TadD